MSESRQYLGKKILVVDDMPIIRVTLRRLLERE
jgi:CheY-like chemotaxis protein